MTDIASLSVRIDTTGVTPAVASLDALTAAGGRAEIATTKVTTATQLATQAQGGASSATRQMAEAILATEAANNRAAGATNLAAKAQADFATATRASATASREFMQGGLASGAALDAHKEKVLAATMAQTGMTEAQARSVLGMTALATATKATAAEQIAAAKVTETLAVRAAALRNTLDPLARAQALLGARTKESTELLAAGAITHAEHTALLGKAAAQYKAAGDAAIHAEQHIGGMSIKVREFLVILRELSRGNFTRLAGSVSILAQAFGILTAAALPWIALGAVLAAPFVAFAAAAAQGSAELAKLGNSLTATHGSIGLTTGAILDLSKTVSGFSGATMGQADAVLIHLAASGRLTADNLRIVAEASLELSRLTGVAANKIGDELVHSFDDAAAGAVKLNEQYHYLTLAQYEQIDALQRAGDKQGAFTLSMQLLRDGLADSTVQMGTFEAAIHAVHQAFDGAWEAMKRFDKGATQEQQIFGTMKHLNDLKGGRYGSNPAVDAQIAETQAKLDAQTAAAGKAVADAQTSSAAAKVAEDGINAHRYLQQVDPRLGGSIQRMNDEIKDYKAKVAEALKADPRDSIALADSANMEVRIAAIKKKYDRGVHTPKTGPTDGGLNQIAKMEAAVTGLRAQIDALSADPLSAVSAAIEQAGATARAAETFGKNSSLASKADALAQSKARLDFEKAALQTSMNATHQSEIQMQADQQATDAQLASQKVLEDFWAGGNRNLTTYNDALETSRSVMTEATVAASNYAIAQRFGVDSIYEISAALEKKNILTGMDAERVQEAATMEALAASQRIRLQAANNAKVTKTGDTTAFDTKNSALFLEHLTRIDAKAKNLATDLTNAFGSVGTAIGGLIGVLTTYNVKQQEITDNLVKQRDQYQDPTSIERIRAEKNAVVDQADARVQAYGDMASAAKGFFKQGSDGYELISKAEQAFRLIEFLNSARSVVIQTAETAAKVGLFGAQAEAGAAAGAANIFAQLGPLGFPVVAAMVAVLAGLGMSANGGSGSAGVNDAANRQKVQGTGSVLGDPAAKSASIADALTKASANWNADLEYTNQMVRSLRSIDGNIGSLSSLLARQLTGASGAFSTSGLNLGTARGGPGIGQGLVGAGIGAAGGLVAGTLGGFALGGAFGAGAGVLGGLGSGLALGSIAGPIGAVVGAILGPLLFGSKTSTTLQDQGLKFAPQTVGAIGSDGISGSTYQQVQAKTSSSFLGITYGTKTAVSTQDQALQSDLASELTKMVTSLRDGVLSAATALGVDGASAVLDAFQVNLGTISLKGLTGQQISDELNAVFSKLGDDMAAALVPGLASLQKVGEGTFDTLVRLAREYQVVDVTLASNGLAFKAVGVASLAARDYLVQLAGGLDNFTSQAAFFNTNFLTAAQQLAPIQAAVTKELARLGITGLTTKAQFAGLVTGLDVSTKAGADLYTALMAVAPAFLKVSDAVVQAATDAQTAATTAVTSAQAALNNAYTAQSGELQTTIDKFKAFTTSLKAFRASLDTGPNSALGPNAQYAAAKAAFLATSAAAKGGDQTAIAGLEAASQTFLTASMASVSTAQDYARDLSAVKDAVDQTTSATQATADTAQQQLDALNAQVSGLLTVNTSVLTVAQAIAALQAALVAQSAAEAAVKAATVPATTPTVTPTANDNATATHATNWATYLTHYGDVAAEYTRLTGFSAGQARLAQIGVKTAEQFAAYHYQTFGQGEGRTPYAMGGMFTNGVVSQPTAFNPAVMGEAGPEAIMPLVRGPNGLAVRASGNDNATAAEIRALRAEMNAALIAIAKNTSAAERRNMKWDTDGLPPTRTGT